MIPVRRDRVSHEGQAGLVHAGVGLRVRVRELDVFPKTAGLDCLAAETVGVPGGDIRRREPAGKTAVFVSAAEPGNWHDSALETRFATNRDRYFTRTPVATSN